MDPGRFSYRALLRTIEADCGRPAPSSVASALRLAFDGHRGQFRSALDPRQSIPYITHPVGTALIAIKRLPTAKNIADDLDTIICVALLHDVLEDTRVDSATLERQAGSKVRTYVEALTKPSASSARTRDERNKEVLERILGAGPTCVFVKLCDSMHNLSRPTNTPADLFAKAVAKAKGPYASLLERCDLGTDFANMYHEAIERAEGSVRTKVLLDASPSRIRTLDEALTHCVMASVVKILEIHDIARLLSDVTHSDAVSVWRHATEHSSLTLLAGVPFEEERAISGVSQERLEHPEHLRGDLATPFLRDRHSADSSVYTVPMQLDPAARFVVSIGFGTVPPPTWLNTNTATVLVHFLAHRMIIAEADRRAALTTAANQIGVRLNVDFAMQLGVTPHELRFLHTWRERCAQAISVTEGAVRDVLASHFWSASSTELFRVSSRIKDIDSIILKFRSSDKYRWPRFEQMEDIAGVRLVCPTMTDLRSVERYLLHPSSTSRTLDLDQTFPNPRRDYVSEQTASGYRGVHLILSIPTRSPEGDVQTIPCELQLRTIFQDTWAAISHATLYQASRTRRRRSGADLSELAKTLERCEDLTENLLRSRTDGDGGEP